MRLRIALTASAASMLVAACGGGSDPPPATPAAPPTGDGSYTVQDYTFPPLTVAPGATVRVVDGDDEPHTLTAEDGSFDTGSFDSSKAGSFTAPSQPGDYRFICKIHPSMSGTLTVR